MHSRIRACTRTRAHTLFGIRPQFGLKNVKYTLNFLANDDVETPTGLVGKKVAPILQVLFSCPTTIYRLPPRYAWVFVFDPAHSCGPQIPADGFAMPESMDIVKKIDEDPALGPVCVCVCVCVCVWYVWLCVQVCHTRIPAHPCPPTPARTIQYTAGAQACI